MEDLYNIMYTINYPEQTIWYVTYNDDNIFHSGMIQPQNCFETGQPYLSTFDTFEDALSTFPQAFVGQVPISALETYVDIISGYPDIWNQFVSISSNNLTPILGYYQQF